MKGIVFTEFLEMVEDRFSPEIADRIIESLQSGLARRLHEPWNLRPRRDGAACIAA